MRNILLLIGIITFGLSSCKSQDPAVKAAREAEERIIFEQAKAAIENRDFVLEADRVAFKRGQQANVSSSTNFVSVSGNRAVVQLALSPAIIGPNGLGVNSFTWNN